MRIALATCKDLPKLDPDDHPFIAALRERKAKVTLPIWDDPQADWDVDVVVIRSTWDYSERKDEFVAWAERVAAKTLLLNPAPLVRWNTDKQRYLTELAAKHVPVVPTAWLERGSSVVLRDLVAARGWGDIVIKPIVGAGSRDTIHVVAGAVDSVGQAFVAEQLPRQAMMVQPFLPKIALGEVSLIFIDGLYSHAVIKKPRVGDFRSQPEFGSVVERHTPTTRERDLAEHVVEQIPAKAAGRALYARVDLVTGDNDRPTLIELEVIEPSLYLAFSDVAAESLAEATWRRASR